MLHFDLAYTELMQFDLQDLIVQQVAAQTQHLVQAPVQMQDLDQARDHRQEPPAPTQTLVHEQTLVLKQTQGHTQV